MPLRPYRLCFGDTPASFSSAAPDVSSAAGSAHGRAAAEADAGSSVTLDPCQPLTNIQIRLADGTRLIQRFNHTHRCSLPLNEISVGCFPACFSINVAPACQRRAGRSLAGAPLAPAS